MARFRFDLKALSYDQIKALLDQLEQEIEATTNKGKLINLRHRLRLIDEELAQREFAETRMSLLHLLTNEKS